MQALQARTRDAVAHGAIVSHIKLGLVRGDGAQVACGCAGRRAGGTDRRGIREQCTGRARQGQAAGCVMRNPCSRQQHAAMRLAPALTHVAGIARIHNRPGGPPFLASLAPQHRVETGDGRWFGCWRRLLGDRRLGRWRRLLGDRRLGRWRRLLGGRRLGCRRRLLGNGRLWCRCGLLGGGRFRCRHRLLGDRRLWCRRGLLGGGRFRCRRRRRLLGAPAHGTGANRVTRPEAWQPGRHSAPTQSCMRAQPCMQPRCKPELRRWSCLRVPKG